MKQNNTKASHASKNGNNEMLFMELKSQWFTR